MNRVVLIRLGVLLEISDDYEEPTHVHGRLTERLGICNVLVAPEDVQRSLIELVEGGLAKAYWLGADSDEEVQGLPPLDHFQDYYFLITDEGLSTLVVWRKDWP